MIKTLIVDDQELALKHFLALIDWKKNGFNVLSATNGIEAWQIFQKNLPELVITDVQMPGMTGIDLANKIREVEPETITIFLSNYDDFEYVRTALNLGIFDYILKNETSREVLYEKMNKVKKSITDKNNKTRFYLEGSLASLLTEYITPHNEQIAEKYIKIFPNRYSVLLIQQKHILPIISEVSGQNTKEIQEAVIKKTIYQCSDKILAVLKVDKYQYIILLHCDCIVNDIAYELKTYIRKCLAIDYSILILNEDQTVFECFDQLHESKGKIKDAFFYPAPTIINCKFSTHMEPKTVAIDYKELHHDIEACHFDKICQRIDQYYFHIIQEKDYASLSHLTKFLLESLLEYEDQLFDYRQGQAFTVYDISSERYWTNANGIVQYLKEKYLLLYQMLADNSFFRLSKESRTIIKYITTHYMDCNLSNEEIAFQIHLSVNRLNIILKKELDTTIWKLLTKTRMDRARELLDNGENKISDIYPMLGYTSLSSFSRAFKKMFGISPHDYRRSLQ